MEFIDEVNMELHAGAGGDGVVAFLHEKYRNMGGPAGGNGGNGGSIIFQGSRAKSTLMDLKYHAIVKALPGENGANKNCTGACAEDVVMAVPLGTIVTERASGKVLAEILREGQTIVIAHGGRGGRGNASFATSRRTAPEICERGTPGENLAIHVELKVLADAGLVGYPSVGKSTILSVVSAAKPRIADYPFTTLSPQLGVVRLPDERSFVLADLPGLIEGAAEGVGLGLEFLRHVERTKVLVHVVDMSPDSGRDPYQDYLAILKELAHYGHGLPDRPQILVANKMDMPGSAERLTAFESASGLKALPISALTRANLMPLLYKIADMIDEARAHEDQVKIEPIGEVNYTFTPRPDPFTITRGDDGVYQVTGPLVEKYFNNCDFKTEENIRIFAKRMRDLGVDQALRTLGVKNGDTVRIFTYEFEFID